MDKKVVTTVLSVLRGIAVVVCAMGVVGGALAQFDEESFFYKNYESFLGLSEVATVIAGIIAHVEIFVRIFYYVNEKTLIKWGNFTMGAVVVLGMLILPLFARDIRLLHLSFLVMNIGFKLIVSTIPTCSVVEVKTTLIEEKISK